MTINPQTERRERYAVAIHDAMEPDLSLVDQEPGCQALFARAAEAAVAVADMEQAELRREHAERLEHLEGALARIRDRFEVAQVRVRRVVAGSPLAAEVETALAGQPPAVLPAVPVPPATHATNRATLSGRVARAVAEDASALRMDLYDDLAAFARQTGIPGLQHAQIRDRLAEFLFEGLLRRAVAESAAVSGPSAADDGQDGAQTYTPAAHYVRDDGVECCVHAIPVGPDSCRECRDLDQPAVPARTAASDVLAKAVAALQAKAAELSTEAEEEMRRDLEEQAQVWHEAADMVRRVGRKAADRG